METIPGRRERLPGGEDRRQAEMLVHEPRERILMAMAELVAKRGYRDTTVEHILKRSVVSRSSFYRMFPNREAALMALIDHFQEELKGRLAEAGAEAEEWPSRVIAVLRAFFGYVADNPVAARACLVESVTAGGPAIDRYEKAMGELAPFFAQGRELDSGDEELGDMVVGSLVSLVHQRLLRGEASRVPSLLPTAVILATAPYLGEKRARELAASL